MKLETGFISQPSACTDSIVTERTLTSSVMMKCFHCVSCFLTARRIWFVTRSCKHHRCWYNSWGQKYVNTEFLLQCKHIITCCRLAAVVMCGSQIKQHAGRNTANRQARQQGQNYEKTTKEKKSNILLLSGEKRCFHIKSTFKMFHVSSERELNTYYFIKKLRVV